MSYSLFWCGSGHAKKWECTVQSSLYALFCSFHFLEPLVGWFEHLGQMFNTPVIYITFTFSFLSGLYLNYYFLAFCQSESILSSITILKYFQLCFIFLTNFFPIIFNFLIFADFFLTISLLNPFAGFLNFTTCLILSSFIFSSNTLLNYF